MLIAYEDMQSEAMVDHINHRMDEDADTDQDMVELGKA
jgi:hypothetical protein